MAKIEAMVKTEQKVCDFCDEIEHYPRFNTCIVCGKDLCKKCENIIVPMMYNPFSVCNNCFNQDIEKIKEFRKKADVHWKEIERINNEEAKYLEELKEKIKTKGQLAASFQ